MVKGTTDRDLVTHIRDNPYTFVRRLSPTEIVLAYGDVLERWRDASLRSVSQSRYVIIVRGKGYRYAGQFAGGRVR